MNSLIRHAQKKLAELRKQYVKWYSDYADLLTNSNHVNSVLDSFQDLNSDLADQIKK